VALAGGSRKIEASGELTLVDDRQALTWAEVDSILNRLTNALLAVGLDPQRQRVAVFAENSAETLLGHLTGILSGLSTVPVNFHLTAPELAYILEDSGSALVFAGPETVDIAVCAASEVGDVQVVGWRCGPRDDIISWEALLSDAKDDEPPYDMQPRPYLHYTSGTTGRPKATEAPPTMFAAAPTVKDHFDAMTAGLTAVGGKALIVSPMYHGAGLNYVRALAGGASVVVLGRFDAERTLAAIDRYKTTTTTMVPTHFTRLLALPEQVRAQYDVSSMQMVVQTGSSCPIDVKRRMIEWWGPVFVEVYGATEAGGTNMISSNEWLEHPGSVGRTMPPFELVVIGENGEELGPNASGQLYFRDTTGHGIVYCNDPEKTDAAHLSPGVFTLGEVGYVDADGYLYITDRVADMVVSGGVNIYPAEAEQALLQHPDVADVACIGVPNADLGEQMKALVVAANWNEPPTPEELLAFCRERLAGYKCPKTIDLVPDIGRNALGKINKGALRAPFWPSDPSIA
jgi:long-chain acyl-CoA synthetase